MTTRAALSPLPDLCIELPTARLVAPVTVFTLADMTNLLMRADTLARCTTGDLERIAQAGRLAYEELKAREGD